MLNATIRNSVLVASILVAALLVGGTASAFTSDRGVPGPLVGLAESPLGGLVLLAMTLVPTVLLGILVGRLINAVVGCFVVGTALAALSMRFGTIEDLAFAGGSPMAAAFETAIWGVVVAILAGAVLAGSGPLPDLPRRHDSWRGELADRRGAIVLATALLAIPVVWLIVQTSAKGQALGGTILASAAVGFVGRMLAPRVQPVIVFAVPALAGAAATAFAASTVEGDIATAFVDGRLSRLAYPMPIDWAAGSLCGVAIGLGWARGFVSDEADAASSTPTLKRAIQG